MGTNWIEIRELFMTVESQQDTTEMKQTLSVTTGAQKKKKDPYMYSL